MPLFSGMEWALYESPPLYLKKSPHFMFVITAEILVEIRVQAPMIMEYMNKRDSSVTVRVAVAVTPRN